MNKEEKEVQVIEKMISIYCKGNHRHKTLCEDCSDLLEYATKRIYACPRKETKTFCSACEIHCYQKERRKKIKEVMRYAGPRMIFHHPVLAIMHVIQARKR